MRRIIAFLLLSMCLTECAEDKVESNSNQYFQMENHIYPTPSGFLKLSDPLIQGREIMLYLTDGDCNMDGSTLKCTNRRNQVKFRIYSASSDELPSGTYDFVFSALCYEGDHCWEPYKFTSTSVMYKGLEKEIDSSYDLDEIDYGINCLEAELNVENLGNNYYKISYNLLTASDQVINGYFEGTMN